MLSVDCILGGASVTPYSGSVDNTSADLYSVLDTSHPGITFQSHVPAYNEWLTPASGEQGISATSTPAYEIPQGASSIVGFEGGASARPGLTGASSDPVAVHGHGGHHHKKINDDDDANIIDPNDPFQMMKMLQQLQPVDPTAALTSIGTQSVAMAS